MHNVSNDTITDKVQAQNPYEETFLTIVGNMYHHILEIGLLNEIDVDKEIELFLAGKEFTNKEKFFLKKLKEDLKFTLEEIRKQAKNISLDNYLFEKEIKIEKGNNLSITFKGFVDKIIYNHFESLRGGISVIILMIRIFTGTGCKVNVYFRLSLIHDPIGTQIGHFINTGSGQCSKENRQNGNPDQSDKSYKYFAHIHALFFVDFLFHAPTTLSFGDCILLYSPAITIYSLRFSSVFNAVVWVLSIPSVLSGWNNIFKVNSISLMSSQSE